MSINELLIALGSYHTLLVVISFLLLVALKQKQGAIFAGTTAFFFLLANFYFPYLLEWDSGNIYRYFVWVFHDVLWMGVIAYLGLNDKVSWRQSVFGQLFCIPILALNAFRAMDKYFIKLEVGLAPYQFIYPVFETAIVALCWLPIFVYLKNKLFAKPQPV
ncbi:hypothetical protein [Pseudoalteromonas sp.]|uniref:hypothetical protein n=1 Tax=Pseudoalteromonas sp. TaxID=53249 RepID=UPI003566D53E